MTLLAPSAATQNRNVQLLGRHGSGFRNDVWGYVAPDGREYALAGSSAGTYVLDMTNPRAPRQRGFIGGRRSTWRDIRTYETYAYIVSEGGGGMQIVSLANPNSPRLIKSYGSFSAHNIAIDVERGYAYPCGTRGGSGGTPILSLADPLDPREVANYSYQYVHDLHVRDNLMHCGELGGGYRIIDITKLPIMVLRGLTFVPACHNVWPTRDNRYSVTTSEQAGGGITVFDITNVDAPKRVAFWRTGRSTTSAHNAFVKDRVIYASYYSEGLVCIDISNPAKPVTVGNYDTSSSTSGFNGAWGCYPFQPSGNVYVTDTRSAFWVFKPKATGTRYGKGTAGTASLRPEIHKFGAAYVGNRHFKIEVEKSRPRSVALLALGARKTDVTASGLNLLVDLTAPHLLFGGATDKDGEFDVPLPIPNDPKLDGTVLYAQMYVLDPNGSLGFAASRGLQFEIFNR